MLRQAARANLYDAWGVWRDQWQCEVTAAGRIWYVVDDEKRLVWVTLASASHPKGTE